MTRKLRIASIVAILFCIACPIHASSRGTFTPLLRHQNATDDAAELAIEPGGVSDPGGTISVKVVNRGPDSAENVRVTYSVPQGAAFTFAGSDRGTCTTPHYGGTGEVACDLC